MTMALMHSAWWMCLLVAGAPDGSEGALGATDPPALRGLAGTIEFDYAGPPLFVRPNPEPVCDLVVRIARRSLNVGGSTRYHVEYIGTVSGRYDLRPFFQDGAGYPVADLPKLTVDVSSQLPPRHGTDLFVTDEAPLRMSSGYRRTLIAGAIAWLAVPIGIWLRRRWRSVPDDSTASVVPVVTLADQIRPLARAALDRPLSVTERGRLELLLYHHWRDTLDLGADPAMAVAQLRADPEAGRLLVAVEQWLHRRDDEAPQADLLDLLEPYRRAPVVQVEHGDLQETEVSA